MESGKCSDWGVPNGMVRGEYQTSGWSEFRWSWEIIRRRAYIRDMFSKYAEQSRVALSTIDDYDGPWPEDPGFLAMSPEISALGLTGLPNPRIGDQPFLPTLFDRQFGNMLLGRGDDYLHLESWQICFIPRGSVAFIVNPRKPHSQQLRMIRSALESMDGIQRTKKTQNFTLLWERYLRVLDADAAGFSISDIRDRIMCDYGVRKNDWTAARDSLNAARKWRDGFRPETYLTFATSN